MTGERIDCLSLEDIPEISGGIIDRAGKGGKMLGQTRASDLKAMGQVYSYRSVLKTLMDLLGADHSTVFPADNPIQDLFV